MGGQLPRDEATRHRAEEFLADQGVDGRKGRGERADEAVRDVVAVDAQPRLGRNRIARDGRSEIGTISAYDMGGECRLEIRQRERHRSLPVE
ncbi:MAG: hypothetical protein A3D94_09225 [Alphaproteobacteria bacterium RIFCSPHIGHO2_12_FULL_66_14]|nr:MAG: hypothetical protein A3D94_09225 [Alphaproteobacteria bacterium RIFCSPHIGHO2_12_FULL_66_14]